MARQFSKEQNIRGFLDILNQLTPATHVGATRAFIRFPGQAEISIRRMGNLSRQPGGRFR